MKPKPSYTTGDVARICRVSQSTVIKLFDRGHLKGFRIPPPVGSKRTGDRRVTHAELARFMRENGLVDAGLEIAEGGAR